MSRTIFALAAAVLVGGASFAVVGMAQELPEGERLKDIVRPGLAIGGRLDFDSVWDPANHYLITANREFNAMTSTSYMAYGAWPRRNKPVNTSEFEIVVDWSIRNNKRVHGHVLVFPRANKDLAWFQRLKASAVERYLRRFVIAMACSRSGDVWLWDVVNEVMADDGEPMDADGLRIDLKEYSAMGPEYVDKAFHWTRWADPDALLILNEYGAEELNAKSDRLLNYVVKLRQRGVPIDGVGFQMHLFNSYLEPDYQSIRDNFARFAAAGFRIFITELDVAASDTIDPSNIPSAAQLERQRRIYKQITKIALETPACESLLLWDYADDRSWLHPDYRGQYLFPTPFFGGRSGNAIIPKPAYYGIQDALGGVADQPTQDLIDTSLRYEIVNMQDPFTGILVRDSAAAYSSVSLAEAEEIGLPSSGIWTFELVRDGVYRIRCELEGGSGYLSRAGDLVDGAWQPGSMLYLDQLQETWLSQMWVAEADGIGFRLVNAWGSAGTLSRSFAQADAAPDATGAVSLQAMLTKPANQVWTLRGLE